MMLWFGKGMSSDHGLPYGEYKGIQSLARGAPGAGSTKTSDASAPDALNS